MAVLALDLGTKTGFAVHTNGTVVSGTQDFTPKRFESSAMRFVKFARFLADLHAADPVTYVVFEEVRRHKGVDAAHAYGGFLAHLGTWCEGLGVAMEPLPVGAVKKFWCGKGNADKDAMIAEAKRRGFDPVDDNEADALAMLVMCIGDGGVL